MSKSLKIFGKEVISWGSNAPAPKRSTKQALPPIPSGRVSIPDTGNEGLAFLTTGLNIIQPEWYIEMIPIIRTLCYTNPDVSQALDNIIQLGNPGHEVTFDAGVDEDEANLMREELEARKFEWADGVGGMDGLVNKMMSQIQISGALSNEWIPLSNLMGIGKCALIAPETIRFVFDKKLQRYVPYQQPRHNALLNKSKFFEQGLIKLNLETYRYYAINGDGEVPYGIPPYLPALKPLSTQKSMLESMDYLIETLGVMGFLAVNLEKPEKKDDISEDAYAIELEQYLASFKLRIKDGLKDSIVAGFKDDTEFEFHTFTKDIAGVNELFIQNELQVGSGLHMDMSMLGRGYGTTETQITVIFSKLLAQIKNLQSLVARNLEFGYTLHLRLAGYDFKSLRVIFNQSTAMDELKFQQAQEIKIRNESDKYYDGITSLDTYARRVGENKADQEEVRYLRNKVTPLDVAQVIPGSATDKPRGSDPGAVKRRDQKGSSAKKVRDKNKR